MQGIVAFDLNEALASWQQGSPNIEKEYDASQLEVDDLNAQLDGKKGHAKSVGHTNVAATL